MTLLYARRFIDPNNQYHRWIDRRLWSLRLADVVAYLESRNWKQLPSDRRSFLVFQEPGGPVIDGKPLCQFVPDSEGYADNPLRLFELLTGVAEVEDRQASEVIDDILRLAHEKEANGVGQGLGRETGAATP
jgi:hypothetical protein